MIGWIQWMNSNFKKGQGSSAILKNPVQSQLDDLNELWIAIHSAMIGWIQSTFIQVIQVEAESWESWQDPGGMADKKKKAILKGCYRCEPVWWCWGRLRLPRGPVERLPASSRPLLYRRRWHPPASGLGLWQATLRSWSIRLRGLWLSLQAAPVIEIGQAKPSQAKQKKNCPLVNKFSSGFEWAGFEQAQNKDSEFWLEWIGLDWLGWIHKLIRYSTRTKFISGFEWAGFEAGILASSKHGFKI